MFSDEIQKQNDQFPVETFSEQFGYVIHKMGLSENRVPIDPLVYHPFLCQITILGTPWYTSFPVDFYHVEMIMSDSKIQWIDFIHIQFYTHAVVIKHGLLENKPWSSVVFPTFLTTTTSSKIFQPVMFKNTEGYSSHGNVHPDFTIFQSQMDWSESRSTTKYDGLSTCALLNMFI
jgi:hypothetical protein